jgi:hypothetical protein
MLVTDAAKILELNLCTMKPGEVEFSSKYKLTGKFNEKMHALVAWWDCGFTNLENPVLLSTSPCEKSTHWK